MMQIAENQCIVPVVEVLETTGKSVLSESSEQEKEMKQGARSKEQGETQ